MSFKILMGSVEPRPLPDGVGEARGLGLMPAGEYAGARYIFRLAVSGTGPGSSESAKAGELAAAVTVSAASPPPARRGDKHVNTGHAAENGSLRLDAGPAGRQGPPVLGSADLARGAA